MIREAWEGDLPDLKRIIISAFSKSTIHYLLEERYGRIGDRSWAEWKTQEIESFFKSHPERVLVTEQEGRIVGFAAYDLKPEREMGIILNNAVEPDSQNQGLGTAQIRHLLNIFRERGMRFAKVVTGGGEGYAPARKMYEKCGFEATMKSVIYHTRL